MKIAVCIKSVPSTNEVRLDPETNTILRSGRDSVINPFDLHALEAAAQLKRRYGGGITAVSMGIPETEELLRDAVARGADRAALLTDRAFAGSDTLATSYALSLGIRALGDMDLILCGKMAVDGDTAQIGPELAEQLGIPHVTDVCEILSASRDSVTVRRLTEGAAQVLRVRLPALLTVVREINTPALPTLAGVRRGEAARVTVFTAEALGADVTRCGLHGSPTQVRRTFVPRREKETEYLTGSPAETARALLELSKEARA